MLFPWTFYKSKSLPSKYRENRFEAWNKKLESHLSNWNSLFISPAGSHEEKLKTRGGFCCSLAVLWREWAVVDVTSSEVSWGIRGGIPAKHRWILQLGGGREEEEEEEEEEEAMEDDTSPWRSKNGKIHSVPLLSWLQGRRTTHLPGSADLRLHLTFFSPEDILQLILQFTNLQWRRSVNEWIDLSEEELWAYLGLLILAGMFRSQHVSTVNIRI